ncbi:MAG: tetratricopeptide repeat protein [Sphingobacteriaceae bacterium]|nr:tetratricopeptide repeat protein [Sphingobacteriaceae bacterium]
MKKLISIFFLFLNGLIYAGDGDLILAAEKAYDTKKYKEAIGHYESLISKGLKSWELYYNLGNAYYRDKQLGKAIYNYELARKLNPNDEDIRINLGIAGSKTVDKIDSKENFFISAVKTNVLASLDTNGWAWTGIVSMFLLCFSIFLFIQSERTSAKRISFFIILLFLISFSLTYFLGYSAYKSKNENKFAILTVREAKIMNEPTQTSSSKFSLHEGTKVRVIEINGDWTLIKLDNGNEGWLKISEIGII